MQSHAGPSATLPAPLSPLCSGVQAAPSGVLLPAAGVGAQRRELGWMLGERGRVFGVDLCCGGIGGLGVDF